MPLPIASNEGEPVMAQLIALTGDDLVVLVRTEVQLEQCGSRPDVGAKRLAAVPLPVPAPREPIMAEAPPLPAHAPVVEVVRILEQHRGGLDVGAKTLA